MKITRIEPLVVGAPTPGTGRLSNKNYIFVRVHTDEGITGLGEASLGGYTQTIVSLLGDLEELLIGEDPTRIEYLAQVMTRQKFWRGGVVKGSAVAGVELALWDILGKSLGVPSDSSAVDALESDEAKEFRESLGEIVPIDDYSKAILEIENGLIEAIAIDEVVARFYLTNDPGAYRIIEKEDGTVESLAVEDYVIGFRKGDQALCDKVNETLKEMKADGTLGEISEKWFGEDVTTIEA